LSADSPPPPKGVSDLSSERSSEESLEPIELADLLNTALDKGVVLHGDVTIAVADIDLVQLNLGLLLSALETVERRHPVSTRSLASLFGPSLLAPSKTAAEAGNPEIVPSRGAPVGTEPFGHGPLPARAASDRSRAEDSALHDLAPGLPERINADPDRIESGLARLVLTLIEVLRKVLEHQAVRRMDGGRLSPEEIERLGLALARLSDKMQDLKRVFGLTDDDLQIDLGPLGRVR
jgi:hypothetical protein